VRTMITYFGNPVKLALAPMLAGEMGMIVTPKQGNKLVAGVAWCLDNGCGPDAQGHGGTGYVGDDKFLALLDKYQAYKRDCLFVVAPDVLYDAAATLKRSLPMLAKIRERGYKAAFVAQDGLEKMASEIPWDSFDCLFIGGSTEWKLGRAVRGLVRLARRHGKSVHFGRVNSEMRLAYAYEIGCDSADGTGLTRKPSLLVPKLLGWLRVCRYRVPLRNLSRREVLKAVAEYDNIGRDAFLRKYGFGKARSYHLVVNGRHYDSKAIVGAAYGYLTRREALTAADFTGGAASVAHLLNGLGFAVINN
jgi:hypothetical protein